MYLSKIPPNTKEEKSVCHRSDTKENLITDYIIALLTSHVLELLVKGGSSVLGGLQNLSMFKWWDQHLINISHKTIKHND